METRSIWLLPEIPVIDNWLKFLAFCYVLDVIIHLQNNTKILYEIKNNISIDIYVRTLRSICGTPHKSSFSGDRFVLSV